MMFLKRAMSSTILALLVLASGAVWAQADGSSTLQAGLGKILGDREIKMAMTPDKTLVLITSQGEASLGKDGKVRLHSAGKLQRMAEISKGFNVDLGEALGHRKVKDPAAANQFADLLKGHRYDFKMRKNGIGFGGKTYTATNRPMDIFGNGISMTVKPDGAARFKTVQRGKTMGFAANQVKARPRVASPRTTSRPTTSRVGFQVRSQSNLRVTAKSRLQVR